jgi:hypothetical protein
MGHREVRRVPLDWKHPQEPGTYADGSPRYRPLFPRDRLADDIQAREDYPGDYEDYPLDMADYMPEIPEGTPLGYQLYETTSEGTPCSPVFGTLEELAAWCETGATVFASMTWTAGQWLASFRNETTDVDSLAYWSPGRELHVGDPLSHED